jgi:hypothetical protein
MKPELGCDLRLRLMEDALATRSGRTSLRRGFGNRGRQRTSLRWGGHELIGQIHRCRCEGPRGYEVGIVVLAELEMVLVSAENRSDRGAGSEIVQRSRQTPLHTHADGGEQISGELQQLRVVHVAIFIRVQPIGFIVLPVKVVLGIVAAPRRVAGARRVLALRGG